jgi:histone-lysine N-methyltransferase SETD1
MPSTSSAGHGIGNGANQYISPASDDHDSDMLRGVGSASSLGSVASSVFTHNSGAFAHNQDQFHSSSSRKASAINGLTPLTNHAESSPPKGNASPQYYATSHSAADMAAIAASDAATSSRVLAAASSSEPTPQRAPRPQMLPPQGTVKGYKAVWDPELDNKLSKEERKRATFRKKDFGTEVRYIFHILLSLHNT